jgi:integrase
MAAIRKTLAPRPGSELKAWRAKHAQELLRLGIRPDGSTRIVTREDGSSPKPKGITEAVSDFMKPRGSAVRLHGLRHSHASHLLAENVHPKIMQERLGHHSISVTMDIYSHLMPNMQAEAAAKLDAVLRAAKKPAWESTGTSWAQSGHRSRGKW